MPFASDVTRRGSGASDECFSESYEVENSLRFFDNNAPHLSWTPSSAGNRKTWTLSIWMKRGDTDNDNSMDNIFTVTNTAYFAFSNYTSNDPGSIRISAWHGSNTMQLVTDQVFNDPSAWYHLVFKCDTTQATDTNRFKLYVNGSEVTNFKATANNYSKAYPAQNFELDFNNTELHTIGAYGGGSSNKFDGHIAEVNFIDGQALTPLSFGEVDSTFGHWKPKAFSGTHGTNGFYLNFDNSASLGADSSANSNNWTPSNLSSSDFNRDSPTNNFPTWNPNDRSHSSTTFQYGNIRAVHSQHDRGVRATFALPTTGKWYMEFMSPHGGMGSGGNIGLDALDKMVGDITAGSPDNSNTIVFRYSNGWIAKDGTLTFNGGAAAEGSKIMMAVDSDAEKIWFGKNGTWFNSGVPASGTGNVTTLHSGVEYAILSYTYNAAHQDIANFGADMKFGSQDGGGGNYSDSNSIGSFYYEPPTDFLALCSKNLPCPAVKPVENFDALIWSGDGSNSRAITGVGFQPDLIWGKPRSQVSSHLLVDTVRGINKILISSDTAAEYGGQTVYSSFDSDGFTLGAGAPGWWYNHASHTSVAWCWKAGGTAVSNTNGSITSSVSANTDAGFSMVGWTGNLTANSTLGHGLSSAPEMIIIKSRTSSSHNWVVYHKDIGNTYNLWLNLTGAKNTDGALFFESTSPTASVFTLGDEVQVNGSSVPYIAYCFHSVDGFSKFGSYVGNANDIAPFVYTGFQPKYVMYKKATGAAGWFLIDDARDSYNVANETLQANSTAAEYTSATAGTALHLYSNGFQPGGAGADMNGNNETYIYMAFAEFPFKATTAR